MGNAMADRPIIIIGAGIGGLAIGCYAQMNGYRTQISETRTQPGGVCTPRTLWRPSQARG
jgi:phytoene dehydrogenase-like protein